MPFPYTFPFDFDTDVEGIALKVVSYAEPYYDLIVYCSEVEL